MLIPKNLVLDLKKTNRMNHESTMALSNCLYSSTSENPRGFSVWCVIAKLIVKSRICSKPGPLWLTISTTLNNNE